MAIRKHVVVLEIQNIAKCLLRPQIWMQRTGAFFDRCHVAGSPVVNG